MLTKEEFITIKESVAEIFRKESYRHNIAKVNGEDFDSGHAKELYLYNYALGLHRFGASDNALTTCMIQDIYTRARAISAHHPIDCPVIFAEREEVRVEYKDVVVVHVPVPGEKGEKGDVGERGKDGIVMVQESQYAFKVVDGNLVLVAEDGATPPDFEIRDGKLVLIIQ